MLTRSVGDTDSKCQGSWIQFFFFFFLASFFVTMQKSETVDEDAKMSVVWLGVGSPGRARLDVGKSISSSADGVQCGVGQQQQQGSQRC